jgi:excisionase family DNA binding protein
MIGSQREHESLLPGFYDSNDLVTNKEEISMKANPCEQVFEPLMNSTEAAKLLRVHPATLQRMARAGQLPRVKVGKLWRFSTTQLDAWVASATTCGRKPPSKIF